MKKSLDHIGAGLVAGLLMPPIAYLLFCLFAFPGENPFVLLNGYIRRSVFTHVVSLSVLVNLGLFFGSLKMNLERAAKGVIVATVAYFIYIAILRLN